MTLEELGQAIKEKREAAGMSLDDVASRIKISARILRSIEEGSLVGLPHAVYTKSFIRSFGQLVGYDPQELNAALEELFPPDAFDESKAESILRANPAMTYPDAGKRFAIIILLLAFFAGLIGGVWYVTVTYGEQIMDMVKAPFSAVGSTPGATSGTGGAGETGGLPNTLSLLAAQPSPPDGQNTPSPPSPATTATNDSPAFAGVNASGPEGIAAGTGTEPEEAASAQTVGDGIPVNLDVSTPGGKNWLAIRVRTQCWISSRADGRVREFMAHPGMEFAITYNDRLEVTFGNAGGVVLSHNGQDLGAPGADGRVVTVRFP